VSLLKLRVVFGVPEVSLTYRRIFRHSFFHRRLWPYTGYKERKIGFMKSGRPSLDAKKTEAETCTCKKENSSTAVRSKVSAIINIKL
jgi:hypothetical protein